MKIDSGSASISYTLERSNLALAVSLFFPRQAVLAEEQILG